MTRYVSTYYKTHTRESRNVLCYKYKGLSAGTALCKMYNYIITEIYMYNCFVFSYRYIQTNADVT
jgi:hypothetical protein